MALKPSTVAALEILFGSVVVLAVVYTIARLIVSVIEGIAALP